MKDERIGHKVNCNGKDYFISCWGSEVHKISNCSVGLGVSLEIQVTDEETGKLLTWNEIKKDIYLQEKVSDFAHNSFNGQNSFYWDWNKHKEECEKCTNVVQTVQE